MITDEELRKCVLDREEVDTDFVDFMTLGALFTGDMWRESYAKRPHGQVDVRMTYAELACIYNLLKESGHGN